jgi:hypothetical protein
LTWRSDFAQGSAFQRLLQVVAPSGHGSATRLGATTLQDDDFDPYRDWPDTRARDAVVTPKGARFKRVAIALAIPLAAFLVMIKLLGPQSESAPVESFRPPVPTPAVQETISSARSAGAEDRSYAVEITALDGLPPDAAPGTPLEIWVTWEPPLTKEIRVQKLIQQAHVQKIIPNVIPEGPATALLRIPKRDVADMLYGDRFGRLSAIVLPDSN